MYPKLKINMDKLKENLNAVKEIAKRGECSLIIVTKALCGDDKLTDMLVKEESVKALADSRIMNIKKYAKKTHEHNKETILLRLPMKSEIKETVMFADISFNSEVETIKLLNDEARVQNKIHKVVLMIDLGDLREGIFFEDKKSIFHAVKSVLEMGNIKLEGIGTNLTCYGAIIPQKTNLSILADIATQIEEDFKISLNIVSGGNSSSIYLIDRGELPKKINNLRLGEAFLLGNDTAYGERLEGTVDDALILEAQIIEIREKPSLPIGEIGVDAFGKKPDYEDRGIIKRGILAIGKQDVDIDNLVPLDKTVDVLGGSSDHLIIDVSKTNYVLGDIISFKVGYGAMLKAATSPYVTKEYI